MNFQEFLKEVQKNRDKFPKIRTGILYFDTLVEIRPDLARRIEGDPTLNPYNNDSNIGNFITFLTKEW